MKQVLLVGNPNCGKTTLFNALTGDNQQVGNWPGVTVLQTSGLCPLGHTSIHITDLPGLYSMTRAGKSLDEQIAIQALLNTASDCLINVVDACHLERHLYLTSQLLELGKPLILALNMMDIASLRGIQIDIKALEQQLGCPVIALEAHRQRGIENLLQVLEQPLKDSLPLRLKLAPETLEALSRLESEQKDKGHSQTEAYYLARRLAEEGDMDLVFADARYDAIHRLVLSVLKKTSDASDYFTAKVDKLVLHRFLGLPLFLAMMYLMFFFAINIGGAFQDFFNLSTDAIFVQGTAWILEQVQAPHWLIALLAQGVGKGINTTMTFIPVLAALFFFLSLLETSGYMVRAAFVVDRLMRLLGLPGKAFVPMIVGFGCNVPAIMAARTLDSERDRLLTVMMSPFMSCSARLAIYSVFVAAFFPKGGQNVIFSLYLLGILMAVLTGFLLRKTSLKGESSMLILELPAYHRPSLTRLYRETRLRLRLFVLRAGKLIIPVCILLGGLEAISLNGSQSILSVVGQGITPLFSPLGISDNNWPATVGLLTGILAKEVVVGTLNTLYAHMSPLSMTAASFDFWGSLQAAFWSIPHHLADLGQALWNPVLARVPASQLSQSAYGMMLERFDGPIGAYAYLLFILLYIPCVSTMAVIRQEANRFYMWTSILWSFLLAYTAAVLFYQMAHFMAHPLQSLLWLISLSLCIACFIAGLYRIGGQRALAIT